MQAGSRQSVRQREVDTSGAHRRVTETAKRPKITHSLKLLRRSQFLLEVLEALVLLPVHPLILIAVMLAEDLL